MINKITMLEIEEKVKGIIMQLVNLEGLDENLTAIDVNTNFSDYHLNSIQFLEFIIEVEQAFDIDITDEIIMDNSNETIFQWVEYIYKSITS